MRAYLCKEGELTRAVDAMDGTRRAAYGAADRRALAWTLVWERLGKGSAAGLACEPYLRDAAFRWLLACARTLASLSTYSGALWRWVRWSQARSLSGQVATTPRRVSDYLFDLERDGRAPRSIVHARDVLRSWFGWLADRDLCRSPITRDVRRSFRVDHGAIRRGSGRRQAMTLPEACRMAAWCGQVDPAAGLSVLLQVTAGLRSAEVAALEQRHLTIRDGVASLTVPGKGQRQRIVELEPITVRAWERYQAATRRQGARGPLLRAPGGGHYTPRQVQRWAKAALLAIGRTDLASHDLRRSAVTLLMEHGASLDEAQRFAGHSNPLHTTRCYVIRRPAMTARTNIEATP